MRRNASMSTSPALPVNPNGLHASRGWLIVGGLLSIFVGFSAMGSPLLFSFVIAQFLAIFALVSGVISLALAIFGKHSTHRVLEALSGIIRIAAGVVLLMCLTSSVMVITLIFAVYLIAEGIFLAVASLNLRSNPGWIWTLISGIAAIILGFMVYARWPSDSAWVLGLFFGINMIFNGTSLLALGLAAGKPSAA